MTVNAGDILLVEDSVRDAALVVDEFEQHRFANKVMHVRDGAEALDCLYRRGAFASCCSCSPAVLLMDLKMPRMDGLEALRQIRSDPQFRFLPIVMMTSSRLEQDLISRLEAGASGYVIKPVDFHAFVDVVKAIGGYWAMVNPPVP